MLTIYSAALLAIHCVLIVFIVLMPTNEFLFLALQIMAKQKLEIDTLDDITEPIPTASLHGVIQTVSPIKKGKQTNYYEGKLIINEQRFENYVVRLA